VDLVVDGTGFHRDGPPFEHEARRLHEGSAARHLVVDDEGDFPLTSPIRFVARALSC
jgi:hypothetical protein